MQSYQLPLDTYFILVTSHLIKQTKKFQILCMTDYSLWIISNIPQKKNPEKKKPVTKPYHPNCKLKLENLG